MNALGYTRISTEKQSEYSLENQERLIRDYCQRNKLNLLSIFKDDGESSYTFDRPDWKALEAFIRKNRNVQYLIIAYDDRLSRNLAEALIKITEFQEKYKIKVLATSDSIETDFSDPSNFMIRAFRLMMAESELHNIRKRTKAGMIQASLNGRFTSTAPYGYRNVRDADLRPILVIDETKAEIVQLIYREYLAGSPIEQVGRIARKNGFKQSGNSAIQRILTNQVYIGMVPVPAYKGRLRPYAKGLHPPIISEQDFWLVQERISGKKRAIHSREEIPLRGVLHCWCGRLVTAGNSKSHTGKYYWYYLCPEHKKNLSAAKLHKQFGELLDAMSISEERMNWLRAKLAAEIGQKIQDQGEERSRLQRELKTLQAQIKSTERRFLLMGNVSRETYEELITEMKADESRLLKKIADAQSDHEAYFHRLDEILPALCRLRDEFEKMPLDKQQQFINIGFDSSLSHDGETYRTQTIHPLLRDKELELKEKKLLVVEKPVVDLSKISQVPGTGAVSNFWTQGMGLLELLAG